MENIELSRKHSNTKETMDMEMIDSSQEHNRKKYPRHMARMALSRKHNNTKQSSYMVMIKLQYNLIVLYYYVFETKKKLMNKDNKKNISPDKAMIELSREHSMNKYPAHITKIKMSRKQSNIN